MERKEAIEVIKKNWPDGSFTMLREALETLIPELKEESEDEKIKNILVDFFKNYYKNTSMYFEGVEVRDVITWIEKQGKQKSANKVEPKFEIKEGMWYVCTQTYVLRGKIVVIKNQTYKSNQDGAVEGEDGHLFVDKIDGKALNYFKPWTIQDANDGDVLATLDYILIFKEFLKDDGGISYCHYDFGAGNPQFIWSEDKNWYFGKEAIIHPATKEQRELLFQKMHEAGYEWNAEKKELKKIEQKPAEEYNITGIGSKNAQGKLGEMIKNLKQEELTEFEKAVKQVMEEAIECGDTHNLKADADMLLRLVQKPNWSEEDESYLNTTIAYLKDAKEFKKTAENCINWLKSLKCRIQPKVEWNEEDVAMYQVVIETEQYKLDVVHGRKIFDVGNEGIKEECAKELAWLNSRFKKLLEQLK